MTEHRPYRENRPALTREQRRRLAMLLAPGAQTTIRRKNGKTSRSLRDAQIIAQRLRREGKKHS